MDTNLFIIILIVMSFQYYPNALTFKNYYTIVQFTSNFR